MLLRPLRAGQRHHRQIRPCTLGVSTFCGKNVVLNHDALLRLVNDSRGNVLKNLEADGVGPVVENTAEIVDLCACKG